MRDSSDVEIKEPSWCWKLLKRRLSPDNLLFEEGDIYCRLLQKCLPIDTFDAVKRYTHTCSSIYEQYSSNIMSPLPKSGGTSCFWDGSRWRRRQHKTSCACGLDIIVRLFFVTFSTL